MSLSGRRPIFQLFAPTTLSPTSCLSTEWTYRILNRSARNVSPISRCAAITASTTARSLSPPEFILCQAPADCATGTCDGCTFHFLLRTPLACPSCDEISNGFRTFLGPCKFGKQEVRKIPYQYVLERHNVFALVATRARLHFSPRYCLHNLTEKFETRRCSMFTIEIEILVGVFILLFIVLLGMVIACWRKNRK